MRQRPVRWSVGAETQWVFHQNKYGREAGPVRLCGAAVTSSGPTTPAMLPRRRPGVVEVTYRRAILC